MVWVYGFLGVGLAILIVVLVVQLAGPRVPAERVAEDDLDLVRDTDREKWRGQRQSAYRLDKRQDDYYRLAAYQTALARGESEAEARARVRREFPFFYLDPAERDTEGFTGDDGNLPIVLRERVVRSARILKELMDGENGKFRTMNALVRACIRKGGL